MQAVVTLNIEGVLGAMIGVFMTITELYRILSGVFFSKVVHAKMNVSIT